MDVSYFHECISFEVKIGYKIWNFASLYRSPSQTKDEFGSLIKNLELYLQHSENESPFLIVVLGDFNARIQGWYQNHLTTFEEFKIDIVISQFSLSQKIKESTHIFSNSAPYINLMFTFQPNLVKHSGVHPSLLPNSHNQTVFAKFNLNIFHPPLYKRLVWHHQQVNRDLMKQAVKLFDWKKSRLDVKKQVSVFSETMMNVFENFILHETITCNEKDLPWMNKQIKTLVAEKKALDKRQKRRTLNSKLLDKVDALQAKLQSSINFFQFEYYRKIFKK